MCIICVEFEKGKLNLGDAVRNYGEMKSTLTPEHQKEIEEVLFNNFPFYPPEYDDYDGGFDDDYWETTGFGD
jgi:hypothetical protein